MTDNQPKYTRGWTRDMTGVIDWVSKLKSSSHFLLLDLFDLIRFAQTLLESLGVGVLG